jgi:hypothetical protein
MIVTFVPFSFQPGGNSRDCHNLLDPCDTNTNRIVRSAKAVTPGNYTLEVSTDRIQHSTISISTDDNTSVIRFLRHYIKIMMLLPNYCFATVNGDFTQNILPCSHPTISRYVHFGILSSLPSRIMLNVMFAFHGQPFSIAHCSMSK